MIHMLLCDDDEKNLQMTKEYLVSLKDHWKEEVQIVTFSDSKALLSYLRDENTKKDILLLDICLLYTSPSPRD